MASFSPVYSLSASKERGHEGSTDESENAQGVMGTSSLLSEDLVFVHEGETVDDPEEGCSPSPQGYDWTSQ